MQTDSPSKNIFLSGIDDIASWQINAVRGSGIKVAMPALQRGYVWSAPQVEGLWDSLVRGLPIGSFLVSGYQEKLVSEIKNEISSEAQPELLLLDGQQRATAIALAFSDPWTETQETYPLALWLDLARPDNNYLDRAFMFRLVSRAHPWGYSRTSQGRLESGVRKKALEAFTSSIRRHLGVDEQSAMPDAAKYPGLSVSHCWPWEAVTPLPFTLLCKAVRQENRDWPTELRQSIERVKFWQSPMPTAKTECWKQKILDLLKTGRGEEYDRLCLLARELPALFEEIRFPVIKIPERDLNARLWKIKADNISETQPMNDAADEAPPDAVEALFVRINSMGTPLGGEELIYSTYKAIWPDSRRLVEEIGENAFIRPASLVALAARLVVSIGQDRLKTWGEQFVGDDGAGEHDIMPAALSVSRFRALIHAPDGVYKNALKEFMEQKAGRLFACAREFLAGSGDEKNKPLLSGPCDYRLGSILMENLCRSTPELYFFFLRWLSDHLDDRIRHDTRRRIIGLLTAVAFFSPDHKRVVRRLWRRRFEPWWRKSVVCTNHCLRLEEGKLLMAPLPSPNELWESLSKALVSSNDPPNKWESWEWYSNLTRKYPKAHNSLYARQCRELLTNSDDEPGESTPVDLAWASFWQSLWNERRLVLYAQRYWLDLFFPGYNPVAPDQREDSDRPFDWDHIFPQGYLYRTRNILKMWKEDWPHTIGNLRAWPMELNRCDGKTTPADKLADSSINNMDIRWKNIMANGTDLRDASFVGADWEHWRKCFGADRDIKNNLAKKSDLGEHLLQAIVERLCAIYRYWYESLEIENIFG